MTTAALFGLYGFELGAGALVLEQKHPAAPALMVDVNFNAFSGNLGEGDPPGGLQVFPRPTCAPPGHGARPSIWPTPVRPRSSPCLQPARRPHGSSDSSSPGSHGSDPRGTLIRPGADPTSVTVDWAGIGGSGVLATHLGFRYRFGPGADTATGSKDSSMSLHTGSTP